MNSSEVLTAYPQTVYHMSLADFCGTVRDTVAECRARGGNGLDATLDVDWKIKNAASKLSQNTNVSSSSELYPWVMLINQGNLEPASERVQAVSEHLGGPDQYPARRDLHACTFEPDLGCAFDVGDHSQITF